MQAVVYYLSIPFIFLVALLPFPLLYGFSYCVYLILFYIIGYRKKIVLTNLQNSFPEKPEEEIKIILKKFYKHFCELSLETFKTLVMSKSTALKRCKVNPAAKELFEKYHKEGKSLIIVMGHFGNWEWGGSSFSLSCPQQLYVIYHPLTNKYFNDLICRMRMKFGTRLIEMKDTFRDMVKYKNEINATAFIADQTPFPENAYWTTFLNQDTPVFKGTEKIAQKMNYPVVYVSVKKIKTGRYELFAETLFENPRDTPEGMISETHTKRLEQDILQQPEIWLWSHRRWKHKRISTELR